MVSDVQALSATRAVPSDGDVPVDQPGGLEDEQARLCEVAV